MTYSRKHRRATISKHGKGDVVASETAIPLKSDRSEFLLRSALALHQQGQLDQAEALYHEILCSEPSHFDALQLLASVAAQKKNSLEALELFDQALTINPDHPFVCNNRGNALKELKRYEEALASYDRAIALYPDYADAYNNRGKVLQALKRYDDALVSCERALALNPDNAAVHNNRADVLLEMKRYEEALVSYDKAIALQSDDADAFNSRGNALLELRRYEDALESYERALELKPYSAEVCSNRGNVFQQLMQFEDALGCYEQALVHNPDYSIAYNNRGNTLQKLRRYEDAVLSYEHALAINPDYVFLFGMCLHVKMKSCDWRGFDDQVNHLAEKIERHEKAALPFSVLAVADSLSLQKEAALLFVQDAFSAYYPLSKIPKRARRDTIRIGYYSADFHDHATTYLMAGLFDMHDRSKFELFAFSFGSESNDAMKKRVAASFDCFFDVQFQSDRDVAILSRDLEIDIAVDLKGFTGDARTGIFAFRAAPIQVNYLGYPGTMGADFIDYLIADRILIPESSQSYYTEKIAYLPDSYQANHALRRISENVFTREEFGLPETGFIFCCFNNSYKITPATFDGWMRILKQVPDSYLWLLGDHAKVEYNLRLEATERGVNAERLIFAQRLPLAEHLARHSLADLFLDTLPCNAHTTASDALWAGLPVLTCMGESFSSRVAASLLHAIQLPELITSTQEEYERLAIELATNTEKLGKIRSKLERNRLTTPLFDTQRFTGHIEEAYRLMYERYQADVPPDHLSIESSCRSGKNNVKRIFVKKSSSPLARSGNKGADTSDVTVPSRDAQTARLQSALALHQQGLLDEAEALYREILLSEPRHFDALQLLASVAAQKKNSLEAVKLFDQALAINPGNPFLLNNRGNALKELKRYEEALASYEKAIAGKSDYADAFYNHGVALNELQRYEEAVASYDRVMTLRPGYTAAYYNRGNALKELHRYEDALVSYESALAIKPDYAEAYYNRGVALHELKRYEDALVSYESALAINPDYPEADYSCGVALQELQRYEDALVSYQRALAINPDYAEAYFSQGFLFVELTRYEAGLASYERALAIRPDYAEACYNSGVVLQKLRRNEEAVLCYERAIILKPENAEFHGNLGNVLQDLRRYVDALASYDRALAIKPENETLYANRGVALEALRRYREAVFSYDKALALKPDFARAHYNRGLVLIKMQRYKEAIASFDKAFEFKPDYDLLFGQCLHYRMQICDWGAFDDHINQLAEKIERHEKATSPFIVLGVADSPFLQKEAALIYVRETFSDSHALANIVKHDRREKIRIGYFSADFCNHPVSFLMAELFELHNRERFELFAFSFGPDIKDEMRERVEVAFDHFLDVRDLSDIDVAKLARSFEIDIAIDLGGFTTDCRTGIFALRAAPIQVSYIGYLGTMGADFIDYLIADATLVPETSQKYYSEKIAYLPSYQVNDTKRRIAGKHFTREEYGLPQKGFVFCCFNNNYKITPGTFDGWMRILKQVDGSVLFLFESNSSIVANLKKEAESRGVHAERLIFGKRLPLSENLARYRLADLFLDTLPYNAGATASDALWAGLPVLTCMGQSFASRVAASLLNAIQLPELITTTQEGYEALAIELATNPEKLGNIRRKLEQNRLTTSLFDTQLFTGHIEEAYKVMYERYQDDLPPDHLHIKPSISNATTRPMKEHRVAAPEDAQSVDFSPTAMDVHADMLHSALTLHQQGHLDEAEALYREILRSQPRHFNALQLLATIAAQKKNSVDALELFDQVLKINPDHAISLNNRGNALKELKRYDEALLSYDKALVLMPDYAEAQCNQANTLKELKRYEEAVASYDQAIIIMPDYVDNYYNRGVTLQELRRYEEAEASFERVIALKSDYAEAYSHQGAALRELKRYEEALLCYDKFIVLKPDNAEAHSLRGILFWELKRYEEALVSCDKVLVLKPDSPEAHLNRGVALKELKRYEEALASYDRAIALYPDYSDAYNNRGNALTELRRYEDALLCYEQVLALNPDCAVPFSNRGVVLHELNRYEEAVLSYDKAIALNAEYAEANNNRGNTLFAIKRYDEALLNYTRALELQPDYKFLSGMCVLSRMKICEWSAFDDNFNQLAEKIGRHEQVSLPFPLLAMADSPFLQKEVALIYVQNECPENKALPEIPKRDRHDKIRIGYFSADFCNHPVSFLTAEMFELHNRERFELVAFCFGPEKKDEMRKRIEVAFDRFFDVRNLSDMDVAKLSRSLEIDIAIDLGGFTTDCRTGIFALRAAPVQISYIGYLGTMGASYIDYLIADAMIVPEESRGHYSEKIVYLPCYQVNDTKRRIAEKIFTREECGLPKKGFVFCCFNNNYKITPGTFDGWMRILLQVEGSVLFLYADTDSAAVNLRKEAESRGVDSERLIFGKRLPRPEYLARYHVADLFLDTFPYNAGTTASDALWAGLPVLTCMGESFASRVAASLLNAIDLPELITATQGEYEALAIELATNPEKLGIIRRNLEQNRLTTPLFDTQLFTHHIEEAYRVMYERYQADLPPDHLFIEPSIAGFKGEPEKSRRVSAPTSGKSVVPSQAATGDHAILLPSALALHQQGRFDEAEALYRQILRSQPRHFDALQLLATIAAQKKNFFEAVALFDEALTINPDQPGVFNNRGNVLKELKRYEEALLSYDKAIALKSDYAEAYCNQGVTLRKLKRYEEAVLSYDRGLALKPDYAEAYSNRGNALLKLKRFEEALASHEKAIALQPDYAAAYSSRGLALQGLTRFGEALASYDKAIELLPDYAEAYSNRGIALQGLMRFEEALASYDKAIELQPDSFAEPYYNRGVTLQDLLRKEEALASYERALAYQPDYDFLLGQYLHVKMQICEWSSFDDHLHQVAEKIERHEKVSPPFPLLAFKDSLSLQKEAALIFVQHECPENNALPEIPKRERHGKIRIGYFSADFCNHPVSFLTAELFELHHRDEFELVAFSFGQNIQDEMRRRIEVAFDRFLDVRNLNDIEVAKLSRSLEIDIAIDLGGFTTDCRTGIFALRAAPVQVGYIGYLGTMGAAYFDYLIADPTIVPEESRRHYSEKIVYLPSYQVNDTKRRLADRVFTREECGLPRKGFVFCCFNSNYKITPTTFDGWMRILRQVEGSVLFLYADSDSVAVNLKKEAESRGVESDRLIFGKRLLFPDHLARCRVADLFLDTLPYNAGATASDALWAGLPVLTCMGESFASRVAASLLNAIQLPELITSTQEGYEALAIELATNPQKLGKIRRKLERNRLTTPLFDTQLFTEHIEEAYRQMYERYQADLQPDYLFIEPSNARGRSKLKKRKNHRVSAPEEVQSVAPSQVATGDHAAMLQSALALHQQGHFDEAEALYREILRSQPCDFDALQLLATIAVQKNHFLEAVALFDQALQINPDHPSSLCTLGIALQELTRYEAALLSYDKALALKDDFAEAYNNRGNTLLKMRRYDEALASYDRALSVNPDYAMAYFNQGATLKELKRYDDALASYDRALVLIPNYVQACYNRAIVLMMLQQYENALASFEHAFDLKADYDYLFGQRLYSRMQICDWTDFDDQVHQLAEKIGRRKKASLPFPLLALIDSPSLQKSTALIYMECEFPETHLLPELSKRKRHGKIRIGYFSADFCDHPVSFLTAELFELHHRDEFELFAFSFGLNTLDEMRIRIEVAFDHFFDVRNLSDMDVVKLSRSLEIDIAIDLGGFTTDSRTGIFALRAAPVQVSYIGYLGTMGAAYIDYLIADSTIVLEESRKHYSEKIVFLPSYQVNDTKRPIAERVFTREECGLPQKGFVFCCFNSNYKITPGTFDGWMRILKQVEGSVLFLYVANDSAMDHLKKEAESRGVDSDRLIFGKRLPLPDHLARYRVADLFLDTLPYNAGATASDALWAGLPVLTCMGESFASRVAASLLHAIQLPELITVSQEEYEALAIELATNHEKLGNIRHKLERNRLTTPLFDTQLFTRHIEKAYRMMYERYQDDLPPDHLYIEPSQLVKKKQMTQELVKDQRVAAPDGGEFVTFSIASTGDRSVMLQSELTLHQPRRFDNMFIYQIFYNQDSKKMLDPGFIPLDNSLNERPDWYEFWVIRDFLKKHKLQENAFYGFFSPKFCLKTGFNSSVVFDAIEKCGEYCDVCIISNSWDQLAYFLNPFEQGEFWHPGLLKISQYFFDEIGLNMDLAKLVTHSKISIFSNYIIAKPRFWKEWLTIADKFFEIAESNAMPELNQKTNYGSSDYRAPIKTFIQERFATVILAQGGYNIVSLDQIQNQALFFRLFKNDVRTRNMLQTCDLLKAKYCSTKDEDFLKMYYRVRKDIDFCKP